MSRVITFFIFLSFIGCVVLPAILKGEMKMKCRYDEPISSIEDGREIETTYYGELKKIDTRNLSDSSKNQLKNILYVYENPDSEDGKIKYLKDFPRRYEVFAEMFDSPDFGELYDGAAFIDVLGKLCSEYPEKCASLFISLASGTENEGEADAPNYLRAELGMFADKNFPLFLREIKGVSPGARKQIAVFMANSEGIERDPVFDSVLGKLKRDNEGELLRIFSAAKSRRAGMSPE